ncbi:MAG: pyridoxal-phosphate dependent enzyme [Bacillota bacterium]|nr:MAG: pyridoxal-phosphate dependent enzyme [Bacillota bacterium]
MLHPERMPADLRSRALRAAEEDPLSPVNLFNITWKDTDGRVRSLVLDKAFTGVEANIVLLYAKDFPTGSHKVGPTYSVAVEKQLAGEITPGEHTLVWPSTGNYGIGGAWVGPRMGYDSLVVLPEMMSQERFERIAAYGSRYIKTPGCESNVKEIYEQCKLLARDPAVRVLNQFEAMANYRFHYYVTGNSAAEAVAGFEQEGIGDGRAAAFVSAMGSAGTLAAGDLLKQVFSDCRIVGLEPIQCPTLFENGYGGHDIQGIGDKHVTWIHNVMNMDTLMCIDDVASKKGLQLLYEEAGQHYLIEEVGVPADHVCRLAGTLGISGVCNILGAIKTAKFYGLGPSDNIITVATDSIDRYHSVMADMAATCGPMDKARAAAYYHGIFRGAGLDWIQEGTRHNRRRWFNLKYYTWVEQQGKTVRELEAQRSQEWWMRHQERVAETDRNLRQERGF